MPPPELLPLGVLPEDEDDELLVVFDEDESSLELDLAEGSVVSVLLLHGVVFAGWRLSVERSSEPPAGALPFAEPPPPLGAEGAVVPSDDDEPLESLHPGFELPELASESPQAVTRAARETNETATNDLIMMGSAR